MKRCLLVFLVSASGSFVQAEPLSPQKSLEVLTRISTSVKNLNYSGAYVYQRGGNVDTYQLVHIFDDKGEAERRESLDGPPKVMLREGERITCYLPDAKYVNLDRHSVTKLFPSLLPENLSELLKVYSLTPIGDERVAAIDAKVVLLEPKDGLRYPYKLWYDPASGLLLKAAQLQSRQGQIMEQFTFTQLQIGGVINRKQLQPKLREQDFKTYAEKQNQEVATAAEWDLKAIPSGFKLVKVVKRNSEKNTLTHMMFSDGLSTVSLFIEPLKPNQKPAQGLSVKESTYLYSKPLGNFQLTVMGDAPEATVMQFANSVAPHPAR